MIGAKEQILEMLRIDPGMKSLDIAKAVGCDQSYVSMIRRRYKIPVPKRNRAAPIQKMINEGLSTSEIARRIGCSTAYVSTIRRAMEPYEPVSRSPSHARKSKPVEKVEREKPKHVQTVFGGGSRYGGYVRLI